MCSNPPRFLNSIKIYVPIKKTNWNTTISSFFVSNVIKHSLSSVNSIWSSARSHLPKTVYDFTIRQINNSLPAYKIWQWRGLSQNPDCFFCLNPESLLHIVAGCQDYLDRVTWGQDSIFNVIANSLQPVINDRSSLYADVNGFLSPSIITGENYLLFLILMTKCLYVLELTVRFQSNL